ncbi:Crp/Fnr family transcriptional regulator [Puia sp.]|jgi:CRP-like cAMP-binding protein|uniref:Crp/Fnr family transcriptional regulator n=1 Tax=Puia sp. TaxID=2045100 RepID=UPI002F403535
MEQAIHFLNSILSLDPDLRSYLESKFRTDRYKKKAILVKEGDIARRIGFIEKGLVRGYCIKEDGSEFTYWFMKEGDIMISVDSFFNQTPADEFVEVVEPAIIHSITYGELQDALERWATFKAHQAFFLQKYYQQSIRRERMRVMSGHDKIDFLVKNYPWLLDRAQGKHIASFLSLTPNYYSTVKGQYFEANPRR